MKPSPKTFVLFIVLLIPVIIFIFLKTFGVNHYDLPVFYEEGVEGVSSGCEWNKGQHYLKDFSFIDQNLQVINDQSLAGKISVINLFYTNCGQICDEINMELTRVQGDFSSHNDIQMLSLSVDPDDRIEVLPDYFKTFQPDPDFWFFLNGNRNNIEKFVKCSLVLSPEDNQTGILYDQTIVLVDKEKRIRGYYQGSREDIDRLILEIRVLLNRVRS